MGPDAVYTREDLGRALTELRLRAGLSVRDVAADADALLGTVAGWFAGQHAPTRSSRTMFERMLRACGVGDPADRAAWWDAVERVRSGAGRRPRAESPYRGFAAFGPCDGPWFFGRDDLVSRLIELIRSQRFGPDGDGDGPEGYEVPDRVQPTAVRGVMVVGMSGVGKSSLVRAGMLGEAADGHRLAGWRYAVMMPGDDPIAALAAALAELGGHQERLSGAPDSSGDGGDGDVSRADGADTEAADTEAADTEAADTEAGTRARGDRGPAILVIDQLEELWTQNDAETREAFSRAAADVARRGDIVPVGVLRADFYGRVAGVPWLATILEAAQVIVAPMRFDQLRSVIEGPAEVAGVAVEPELVEMLLDDLAPRAGLLGVVEPGVLPMLSHALRATWEQSDGRRLTVRDYLATGRIGGAVEQTAEAVYASLSDDERAVARRMLLAMINVDEDTVNRRTVRLTDLGIDSEPTPATAGAGLDVGADTEPTEPTEPTETTATRVLERFATARLVTVWTSHAQIAHEALLTAWPRLIEWIDADRERLLLQRRLRTFSDPWAADGRPDDLLLGPERLAMFRPLGETGDTPGDEPPIDLSSRDYLAASVARHDAEVARKRRGARQLRRVALVAGIFGVVALLAAVAAVVAGLNAVAQRERAENVRNEALSRQLAVEARELDKRDPMLAAQLAMIGYRQAPTVEARSALIDTMAGPVPTRYRGEGGGTLFAKGGGSILAALGSGGQIRLFRIGEHGVTAQITDFRGAEPGGTVGGGAISPDGATLLVGGRDRLTAWDITDPTRPVRGADLPGAGGDVNNVAFSPDGRTVLAAVTGTGVQAWTAVPGGWQQIPLPAKVMGTSGDVVFSPDGTLAATSSATRRIDLWSVGPGRIDAVGEIALTAGRDNALAQALTFTPDGRRLIAGQRTRTLDVFDVSDPRNPRMTQQFGGYTSYANSVAVSADGTRVAGGGADNATRIFDLTDPTAPPLVLPSPTSASGVQFAGSHLIVATVDGRVQDWPPDTSTARVGSDNVYQIPADGSGRRILASDNVTGSMTQWRLASGGIERAGPNLPPPPDDAYSGAVVMSTSGRTATLGTVSGRVFFADYAEPSQPRLMGAAPALSTLNETVDFNERTGFAVTGATDSRSVVVIDAADRAAPRVVGRVDVGSGVTWVSLSPDGRRAAVATTTGQVRMIDLSVPSAPRMTLDAYRFGGSALCVRFSPDGQRIAVSSDSKAVAIVDVSTPQPRTVAEMSGPAGQLYSVGFSADGARVVAGGGDSQVWVWRIDGSKPEVEAIVQGFAGTVFDVRFAADDVLLASGGNGAIDSWRMDPDRLIADACRRPGGGPITDAEWRTYLPAVPYDPPCR
ncbi:hypothetical protein GCM10009624_02610 [Gordonia sinesedis]